MGGELELQVAWYQLTNWYPSLPMVPPIVPSRLQRPFHLEEGTVGSYSDIVWVNVPGLRFVLHGFQRDARTVSFR